MKSSLREEIQQTRPFRSVEHEAALNLLRTADQIERPLVELIRQTGITRPQYNVLRILRGAGPEGLTAGEVGARMLTGGCDVTRLLDRLVAQGLVERSRSADDRRVVMVKITAAGLDLLHGLDEPLAEYHLQRFGHLGEAKLRQLIDLLTEVRQGG